MSKIRWTRVLGGVAGGMAVVVLYLWLVGPQMSVQVDAASFGMPLNDGAERWSLKSEEPAVALPCGAKCVTRHISGPARCTLTLAFFDEKQCRLQVASQNSSKDGRFIADWAASTTAIACCNGGYFNPSTMEPASLEIASGVRTGILQNADARGGAVGMRSGVLFLEKEQTVKAGGDVTEFLQCGPVLVEDGKPLMMPDERQRNRRTFVMTDRAGHWAIGVVNVASYSGLAAMLLNPEIIPEFKVKSALNMDGGPSTGLWWRDASGKTDGIKETWKVRNVLLVIPK